MVKPKVSVVVPMYNAQDTILKSLDSIVNQTYIGELEVIIVDDGSTDNSNLVVCEYIDVFLNDRITIRIIKQENGGVSQARNKGMRDCTGTYIAFLDSDDTWDLNKLDIQVEFLLKDSKIDFLGCNRNGEFLNSFCFKKFGVITKVSARLLLYKNFFAPPSVIMKREIIDFAGFFNESLRFSEEVDYWIRICSMYNCYFLNKSLLTTGDGKPHFGFSGLSSNLWEMEKGELRNLRSAKNMRIVNYGEYLFTVFFSLSKYLRRVLIVKMR